MFARAAIVQNNFSKAVQDGDKKTDEELLAEMEAEEKRGEEEFDLEYLGHSGFTRYYLFFCSCCKYITSGELEQIFNYAMIFVITVAALLVVKVESFDHPYESSDSIQEKLF